MKIVTRTVNKNICIADDGREFENECDCLNHEYDLKRNRLEARFRQSKVADGPNIQYLFEIINLDESVEKSTGWYIFRSDEDLETAKWYARYAGGAGHLPLQKDTLYYILDCTCGTCWFSRQEIRELQKAFEPPVIG